MENSAEICSACNAQIQPGSKFCTECGKPVTKTPTVEEKPSTVEKTVPEVEKNPQEPLENTIQKNESVKPSVNCPHCNAELTPEDKFCTECGTKTEPIKNCPKCNAIIEPGTKFCTECGTNIYEYVADTPVTSVGTGKIQTEIPSTNIPPNSTVKNRKDPMEDLKETGFGLMKDVEKTGRGLMKDLGGFLDKSSSKKSSKGLIKPTKKEQHFLVCDKCGGYYELQKGESPEDFSDECECGGHLEHKTQHP